MKGNRLKFSSPFGGRWNRVFLFAVSLSAIGCGTGEYERRMDATLAVLRTTGATAVPLTEFDDYLPQNSLLGEQVNVRVPKAFNRVFVESSLDESATPPVTPFTIYPAGVKLLGYGRTWEASIAASDGTRWPYYIHFAASKAPGVGVDQFATQVQQQLKAAVPQTPASWQDVELTAPDASTIDAKKMRIETDLVFFDARANREQRYPGVVELYVIVAGDYQVILSSQCMKNFEAHTNITKLLETAASTLQIANKSPAAL